MSESSPDPLVSATESPTLQPPSAESGLAAFLVHGLHCVNMMSTLNWISCDVCREMEMETETG